MLLKEKGQILTATEIDNFIKELYNKFNNISQEDINAITTGQIYQQQNGNITFYNYCGQQMMDIYSAAISQAEIDNYETPFTNLKTEIETIYNIIMMKEI